MKLANIASYVGHERTNVLNGSLRHVEWDAARTHKPVVHSQTGDSFKDAEDLFAAAECDGHHRCRAQLVTAGTDGDHM